MTLSTATLPMLGSRVPVKRVGTLYFSGNVRNAEIVVKTTNTKRCEQQQQKPSQNGKEGNRSEKDVILQGFHNKAKDTKINGLKVEREKGGR